MALWPVISIFLALTIKSNAFLLVLFHKVISHSFQLDFLSLMMGTVLFLVFPPRRGAFFSEATKPSRLIFLKNLRKYNLSARMQRSYTCTFCLPCLPPPSSGAWKSSVLLRAEVGRLRGLGQKEVRGWEDALRWAVCAGDARVLCGRRGRGLGFCPYQSSSSRWAFGSHLTR